MGQEPSQDRVLHIGKRWGVIAALLVAGGVAHLLISGGRVAWPVAVLAADLAGWIAYVIVGAGVIGIATVMPGLFQRLAGK